MTPAEQTEQTRTMFAAVRPGRRTPNIEHPYGMCSSCSGLLRRTRRGKPHTSRLLHGQQKERADHEGAKGCQGRCWPPKPSAVALATIRSAGVVLRMDGPRLLASPRSAVTAEVAAFIVAHRAELIALLRPPPCPIDVAEAAAIRAEAGTPIEVAERDALRAAGFEGWGALAARMATDIGAELERLPGPSSGQGARLLRATRQFVGEPLFAQAVAAGWSISALFGVRDLPHAVGVIVRLALEPRAILVAIYANMATLEISGQRAYRGRFGVADIDSAPPWWAHPAIVSESGVAA